MVMSGILLLWSFLFLFLFRGSFVTVHVASVYDGDCYRRKRNGEG